MFKPLKHPHVRILDGIAPLIGKTGVITDKEGKLYRVTLDEPVEVDGVGTVTDELWEPAKLKVIRPPVIKPVIAPAAEAPAAVAELPETVAPAEAAPPAAPEAAAPEAATPAAPAADLPAIIAGNAAKARKPKALSAKGEAQARAGLKVTDEPRRPKAKKLFTGKPKVDRK